MARAHVRPSGLAGLVLWFGELVGTPPSSPVLGFRSNSGFSVQFRVFSPVPGFRSSSGFSGFGFWGFSLSGSAFCAGVGVDFSFVVGASSIGPGCHNIYILMIERAVPNEVLMVKLIEFGLESTRHVTCRVLTY